MSFRDNRASWQVVRCVLATCVVLFANAAQGQTLGAVEKRLDQLEKAVRQLQKSKSERATARRSADDVALQLDRRLTALERSIANLTSAQQRDHRELVLAIEPLTRAKGDVEARLEALEAQVRTASLSTSQPIESQSEPIEQPRDADGLFKQAMDYGAREDWTKAEFAFDTFITSHPSDARVAEARYQLGRALRGQGKNAQAAQIFLDLYEKHPNAQFMIDNLFALGAALSDLGSDSVPQACGVYTEIDLTYGATLSVEQRSQLLEQRIALKCAS